MSHQPCRRCRYWKPVQAGIRAGHSGECRREAPRLSFAKGADARGQFPTMAPDEWCGRFEYKDGDEPMAV